MVYTEAFVCSSQYSHMNSLEGLFLIKEVMDFNIVDVKICTHTYIHTETPQIASWLKGLFAYETSERLYESS